MVILNVLENKYYRLAYENGLQLSGIEDGRPFWIGTDVQLANYHKALEDNNL